MPGPIEPLILDFVQWVAERPRAYADALEAWRTSCPRLTVWEEAFERGLVTYRHERDGSAFVVATEAGLHALARSRAAPVD
jgi:hypothetical protein